MFHEAVIALMTGTPGRRASATPAPCGNQTCEMVRRRPLLSTCKIEPVPYMVIRSRGTLSTVP